MAPVPVPLVSLFIFGAVAFLICLITCCAVRCFRPQNKRGPEWYANRNGNEQTVKAPFRADRDVNDDGRNWLRAPPRVSAT